jgi:hypothetical protein
MPTMSPEVQAYGQQPTADQAEDIFKERFTKDAYAVLFAKFADLAPQVVTFKILETDLDTGKAVGTFIVLLDDRPVYIPVVMIESQLKPLDMFYYKELNIFLPLTNAWLEEISKMNLNEMGSPQELPNEVPRDVNIRDLVMPPQTTTGRVGLAHDMEHTAGALFKEAEDQDVVVHPKFMEVIRNSPRVVLDGMKLAFERHPRFLQKVAQLYGVTELQSAFHEGYRKAQFTDILQEKVASSQGELHVLTKTASPDAIKQVFGHRAGDAFSTILKKGFVYKDARPTINKAAVKVEGEAVLQSPGPSTAWYRLFFVDAPAGDYFVVPFPKKANSNCVVAGDEYYSSWGDKRRTDIDYLVIKADGSEAWTETNVMGIPLENEDKVKNSKVWNLLKGNGGTEPVANSLGFFIYEGPRGVQATRPVEISQVVSTGGRTKYIGQYGNGTYIKDDDPTRHTIEATMKNSLMFLPKGAQWVELARKQNKDDYDWNSYDKRKSRRHESIIKDPKLMMRWLNAKLHESGARPANVKRAALGRWWVEGDQLSMEYPEALQKVATVYGVSVEDASGLLHDAHKHGRTYAFIVDKQSGGYMKTAMDKWAQPPMQGPMGAEMAPGQGMPPGGAMPPGMAPPMQGEMPMGPPAQSPMSATDLAIAEVVDGLQQQNNMQMQQMQDQMMQQQQAMNQRMEMNNSLIGALQQIQGRAQEIEQATGGVIPAGAEQSPAQAAQMLAPQQPPPPEPPPQPMMPEGNVSPEMIAQQINPELAEQAGELNDQGVFDTAAIATLAAAPVLQDIVASYIPNMEKCLDNLGRVLLTLWMKEPETKETIGDEAFSAMEDKLRTVFKNLGETIILVNQNAVTAQQGLEQAQMAADQQ